MFYKNVRKRLYDLQDEHDYGSCGFE